jgi:type IV pilus assembly protein PilC
VTRQRSRRRLAELCARLASLQEESVGVDEAARLLAAERHLPSSDGSSYSASLAELVKREGGQTIGDYMVSAEAAGLAPKTLRFLAAELDQGRNIGWPVWLVATEFSVLITVAAVYGIFVLPAYQSLFEDLGADLPAATRFMFMLLSPSNPFVWGFLCVGIVAIVWRGLPVLLGPLAPVLDRIALALPEVGPAMRTRNADALAGWLGHVGPTDHQATDRALRAAVEYASDGLTLRSCRRLRTSVEQGPSLQKAVRQSHDFDAQMSATMAAVEGDSGLNVGAVLRARWRAAQGRASRGWSRSTVIAQILIGVLVAFLVSALYLPIFKIGSFL